MEKISINIETLVGASVDEVWDYWTLPEHIVQWNTAIDTWHSPRVENDVTEGGKFNIRMEAKDGSFGFDFCGTYDIVVPNEYLEYTLEDGRKVKVIFTELGPNTHIEQEFEAESENSPEVQQEGWQAILDNFKKYVENL
ncbi:MAG: SRPBCC domain-containing protein [Saprospiraceae bacterium]|nr:SRPBCC domain-containing protein [Saprospiraceae bacterium]